MIIRNVCWHADKEQLSNFDASFSTEYVYRVVLNGMSAAIVEEKLDTPLQKIFLLDVERDIKATFSVVSEISKVIVGFITSVAGLTAQTEVR